ncbi:hypothetical protein M409DRAFT_52137 [Zasmidium cellare ATCC 36951]|uniref:Autophagy-related protein 27 n=1 Tax=Zasmidium cellare ATCC 36951 TaxID=1080233 RepID=A0A6A6CTX4_ZASCE|nr:uncharacterized protein M409DRAFT_52137 [Zasmidium cellare ATCC 36951]KAF2169610.1 hypothetical protein M409DRAFT_52137 [Zasmidium cellare ATCC 36951]
MTISQWTTVTFAAVILLATAAPLHSADSVGGGDYDRCSWFYLANIDMKEARCEPASGGVVPRGAYVAGPIFGDFERAEEDIFIKSYDSKQTNTDYERSSSETNTQLKNRHHPHRDDRKFLMLIDNNGCEIFKACGPTCVDVEWADVPARKRIEGFGRKSKDRKPLSNDFIPKDLLNGQDLIKRREPHRGRQLEVTSPNITTPHTPWTKDTVSYMAVMDTPHDFDFQKCVSHVQQKGNSWTEEEHCHRIDWSQIPVGQLIAGFGQKKNSSRPADMVADTRSIRQARGTPVDCTHERLERHDASASHSGSRTSIYKAVQFNIDRRASKNISTANSRVKRMEYDFSASRIVTFLFEEELVGDPRTYTAYKDPDFGGVVFTTCTYGQPWNRLGDPDYTGDEATMSCTQMPDKYSIYLVLGYLISFAQGSMLEQAALSVLILRTGGIAMFIALLVLFGILFIVWAVWYVLHMLGILKIRSLLGIRHGDGERTMMEYLQTYRFVVMRMKRATKCLLQTCTIPLNPYKITCDANIEVKMIEFRDLDTQFESRPPPHQKRITKNRTSTLIDSQSAKKVQ